MTTRRERGAAHSNTQHGAGPVLLGFTCALCVFLSLIVSCLTAVLVFQNQGVSAANILNDTRSLHDYLAMTHRDIPSDISFRLPPEVRPLTYVLYLHPDLEKGTFEGRVSILLDIRDKRKYIALHQKELNISSVNLDLRQNDRNHNIEIKESYPLDEHEFFIITPNQELVIGVYTLTLTFSGSLQDKIVGFYSSKYKDEKNETRTIATSKFEPTYARRSFPCFDEPAFKAEFVIKLVHPTGNCYSALSNMNVRSTEVDEPAPGLTTVTFAKSVPMSTYLACFVVSDFVAVTRNAKGMKERTFPISVYTTRAQKEKATFALDIGVQIIEYYIKLFDIDYPLPKLDMAAIPDFVSGAMENWGLVTYREARLLYDKKTTSTANREDIVMVIAHEFAHMWFGNLVTMRWWNDLWLNEGFATFMQFKSSDAILPEWHFMDSFLLDELHPAMVTDSKLSSHPIVQTVSNPDEITAIFDVISYQKGASILRMLENFVGPDVFYRGVTEYLKKFAFENAETVDLFDILQETLGTHININAIMDTWTRQMGFPVVNVTKHKLSYTLTQKRFLANRNSTFDPSESNFGYKWTIPITYVTSENSTPTLIWFDKDAPNLVIKLDEPVDWIKFNADQVGYYRVNYNQSEWESLMNVLRWSHKRFSVADRTHLLEDAFSLADAGLLDYATALNITLYLGNEKHFSPWYVANNKVRAIDMLLSSTDISTRFREYVRELVDGVYHDVTWNVDEIEQPDMLNLRTTVLGLACAVGHTECLEEVGVIFKAWIDDEKDQRPHPDIRSHVYYYGMNHAGSETEWNKMFDRFINESNAAEKVKLMNGLAGIRSSFILKKYIGLAMDENYVRSQDALNCLRSISSNPDGTSLIWDWVRENWPLLVERYTLNDRYLGQLIPAITKSFSTKVKLDEMKAFFEKYPEAGAGAIYRAQALEAVETNINWLDSNSANIDRWLESRPTPRHVS
ncbi:glutamyl aminopeptidase isoform X1 [Nasonia vitripennis]|uniref:Aminopeptidase n=1 Tax=Nasonia vitripennis TaxID=7425 RepID=A0A7M7TCR3_NASVI|nr:glutamyl aminopeptidase isoform X1 [Nasonia vitripennis]XP_032454003.1 glutamyl aminopeptidase isoform X1 [Nasonia vitripennis]